MCFLLLARGIAKILIQTDLHIKSQQWGVASPYGCTARLARMYVLATYLFRFAVSNNEIRGQIYPLKFKNR
jgi:hypothetical protein